MGKSHRSSVTGMSYMFQDAKSFDGDLTSWDVSSVTDMMNMFNNANKFNGNIEIEIETQ